MIQYLDLVGQPWETLDCKAVATIVLDRLGFDVAPGAWTDRPDLWARATPPYEAGDVILSHPGSGSPHVTILVHPRGGLCLTSSITRGVATTNLVRALPDSSGCYRYQGARR